MELNKLLRRKEKAEDENNQQALAEMCNKLGNHYMNDCKYQKALGEFRQESHIYQALSKSMDFGRANRMIGEVFMMMEKYDDALRHSEIYLKLAKQENDFVELQRAYATIGRCYLLKGGDESSSKATSDFKAAEKAFLKSLIICKDLGRSVSKWELADMQARIYLNLGVTKEHILQFDEAISFYETAIKICKSNDLFELHHQCLMASGHAHFTKKDDTSTALVQFNSAMEVTKRIHDKNEKTCETLLAKSALFIKNGDFQSAKQVLKKCYKLSTPNKSDSELAQKKLKIVLVLCKCEDELVITDSFNYTKRKELFEKLGDGACKLKNFTKAVDFYLKSLEAAQLDGDNDKQLIPIFVSLYQTYIDDKQYEEALKYMNKEYELIQAEPKEACTTLLGIGNLLDLAQKEFWEIDRMYRKALEQARNIQDRVLEQTVMQRIIKLCRKRHMISLAEIAEQEAADKGMNLVEQSEDIEYSEDIPDISNEISLELQLSSDADSSDTERKISSSSKPAAVSSRKRRPAITVKKNAKGETRLHEACINGNYQVAKMLIDQGHGLNVRDNAGWLPLHEAAIHGHRDIAELLLDSGAQTAINDKGGTSCDGITPLYDAASNGNLSVVQLFLDRGAKATLKTDFNETPYDALLRWHNDYGRKLSESEKGFYETIKHRLMEQCEKVGIDPVSKNSCTSSSGYKSAKSKTSQSPKQRQSLRFNTSFSEESDEEPTQKREENEKKSARHEYKSVMDQLKKATKESRYLFDEPSDMRKRSAHLTAQEVEPDNWLVDDLGPSRKKQKFIREPSLELSRSPAKAPALAKSFSRNSSINLIDSGSDIESNNENAFHNDAFDVVMAAGSASTKQKPRRRSVSTKLHKKSTSQASLLESGFARFVEKDEFTNKSPAKATSSNSTLNESFKANSMEKQIILKVRIDGEKVIVPIGKDASSDLKISWLAEEASRRYYILKGIRPELKLKTADGATLLQTDPVAMILSLVDENVIDSEILDWKLPSLSKRYMEACTELKCTVDQDIMELLEINRTSMFIDLSNQNFTPSAVRPVLKALQHQHCLLQLDMSSNFIQDEGVKCLSQTLVTLKQLQMLDVSGNMITESGFEFLHNFLAKSENPTDIQQLRLSFNPIGSTSLRNVSNLCQRKNIAELSLSSCDLTDTSKLGLLASVKFLDVSYNHLTREGFCGVLNALKPEALECLNLGRCSAEKSLGEPLVRFLSSTCNENLREINLSGLSFDENEILDILRCLESCDQLKSLDMSNQSQMTFLSVKYLLFSLESDSLERVKLLGCKNLKNTDNWINMDNISVQRTTKLRNVQLSLPQDSTKTDFINKMSELWDAVCVHRGKTDHDNRILRLVHDDDSKELPLRL